MEVPSQVVRKYLERLRNDRELKGQAAKFFANHWFKDSCADWNSTHTDHENRVFRLAVFNSFAITYAHIIDKYGIDSLSRWRFYMIVIENTLTLVKVEVCERETDYTFYIRWPDSEVDDIYSDQEVETAIANAEDDAEDNSEGDAEDDAEVSNENINKDGDYETEGDVDIIEDGNDDRTKDNSETDGEEDKENHEESHEEGNDEGSVEDVVEDFVEVESTLEGEAWMSEDDEMSFVEAKTKMTGEF